MRYGYWLPVFGGWLRNVENENMEVSWAYVKKLAQRSEQIGFDLTLIADKLGVFRDITDQHSHPEGANHRHPVASLEAH